MNFFKIKKSRKRRLFFHPIATNPSSNAPPTTQAEKNKKKRELKRKSTTHTYSTNKLVTNPPLHRVINKQEITIRPYPHVAKQKQFFLKKKTKN